MKNNPIIKKWFHIQFEGFLCLIRLGFLFYFIFVIFFGKGGSGLGRGGGPFGSLDTGSSYNCCILSDNIQEISENAMCSTQRNQLQFFY